MQTITNHIKVTPPNIPAVLRRPRLLDLLNKNQDKRLVFILGQAAQGKTTLAASYVGTQKVPIAWLNLDQNDSDPVNLFYSLLDAFQNIFPEQDFSFLRSYPSMSQGAREPALRYMPVCFLDQFPFFPPGPYPKNPLPPNSSHNSRNSRR